MDATQIQNEIIDVCRRLHGRNLLASADGNVSYRHSDSLIHMTPTGINKARLRPDQMATLTLDGRILRGEPSGERAMHLEIYGRCPLAKAIVHAHPPSAIAWTVAFPQDSELPAHCLSEVILAVGRIPIAPYTRPGTSQMGEVLRPHLPQSRTIILSRHGAVSWGETLEEAYNGMERLEHSAEILWRAKTLGQLTELPPEETRALYEMREKMGPRTR